MHPHKSLMFDVQINHHHHPLDFAIPHVQAWDCSTKLIKRKLDRGMNLRHTNITDLEQINQYKIWGQSLHSDSASMKIDS